MAAPPIRVLFVCDDNSARSQMAEAWLRHLGGDRFVARSAGVSSRHLHPAATEVMQEVGVYIGAQRGKGMDAMRHERFEIVVTLSEVALEGCADVSPIVEREHVPIDDPGWIQDDEGWADVDEFRRVRDEIRLYVDRLVSRFAS